MSDKTYSGHVAIVGRPNVGKSTLTNFLIGEKVSITARKPQTTRNRILGIRTDGNYQIAYVDTPGLHTGGKKALNKQLNRTASQAIFEVDIVCFMVEAGKWLDDDEWILKRLTDLEKPVILVINKIDKLKNQNDLFPYIDSLQNKYHFADIISISAKSGKRIVEFEKIIEKLLPEGPHLYNPDHITDKSERFWVSEIIREKLIRTLGQELPHAIAIEIEQFVWDDKLLRVSAIIWVERDGQKKIVVGRKGDILKKVGTEARLEMEDYFEAKIFLQLWVKVKKGWSDDERALHSLGFKE